MFILTGGAGFIGSCFLKELNNNGISDIIVVDRLGCSEKWKNLRGKQFKLFLHKDDFRVMINSGDFDSKKIEAIFHIGACSSTTETNCDYIFDNNYNYSIELAQFAIENNIRFIYASSAATYGNGSHGYSDKEYDSLLPLNPYGMTKHLFDLWVIRNGYDKIFTGMKFFNVFGPNEYHKGEMASMAYKSYLQIRNTGKVRLFKSNSPEYRDGEQMRDFIYIKDVSELMYKIYCNGNFSGIYNIGTGVPHTWNDLVKSVFNSMNIVPEIEYIDMPGYLSGQYQNYTCAELDKLLATGFNHDFRNLEDSISDYIGNYLLKEQVNF